MTKPRPQNETASTSSAQRLAVSPPPGVDPDWRERAFGPVGIHPLRRNQGGRQPFGPGSTGPGFLDKWTA